MTVTGDYGRDGDEGTKGFEKDDFEQLALNDDDERLPWLESGEEEEEAGVDTGRIVGFALVGLVTLAVLVGLVWWATHRGGNPELIADGSTIEAPDTPYKTKPEDPGGKEFAGTGDTSFKVGEGEATEGRLAATETPKPSPDLVQTKVEAPASDGGIGVQVGAYSSREAAQAGWNTLYTANEALHGYKYRIVLGQADIGTVYRLQAVAADSASAEGLCAKLKAAGTACQVKR